jgi:hypothetical protein
MRISLDTEGQFTNKVFAERKSNFASDDALNRVFRKLRGEKVGRIRAAKSRNLEGKRKCHWSTGTSLQPHPVRVLETLWQGASDRL